MSTAPRVTRKAWAHLHEAARYYKSIHPPRVGEALAADVLDAFLTAVVRIGEAPLTYAEHPRIAGIRSILLGRFPYLVFYKVKERGGVVVFAVKHAASDYVEIVKATASKK